MEARKTKENINRSVNNLLNVTFFMLVTMLQSEVYLVFIRPKNIVYLFPSLASPIANVTLTIKGTYFNLLVIMTIKENLHFDRKMWNYTCILCILLILFIVHCYVYYLYYL